MQNDMSTAESKAFISDLASAAQPILVLSGGEPLFRPDIFELIVHRKPKPLLTVAVDDPTGPESAG